MSWLRCKNGDGSVKLSSISVMDYAAFGDSLCEMLADGQCHVVHYFAMPMGTELRFFALVGKDDTSEILIASHVVGYYDEEGIASIAAKFPQLHPFEREIAELYGIKFNGSNWDKPLRYPYNRANENHNANNYPFYGMDGDSLHQVNVGPIHAGIIEPGAFRFICNGEKVMHLEIALGYQHRGVENLIVESDSVLRQVSLAQSVAGDSAVAHATAHVMLKESLYNDTLRREVADSGLHLERTIALELERIAMHIADTGALCMDIGYQLGQVACEALRTIVINTTQSWCGNRFGKDLIRPLGSYYPLTRELCGEILNSINEVARRYDEIMDDLKSSPTVLSRLEECGVVTLEQVRRIGAVGMAARASGLRRDVRITHPWGVFGNMIDHYPIIRKHGDVMARLTTRGREVEQSIKYVERLIRQSDVMVTGKSLIERPDYGVSCAADSLSFALIEGWRGEICHSAVTDSQGNIVCYKIKDPSMHNWMALALAVRGEGISDFPICNKSFNLSYCGHDL